MTTVLISISTLELVAKVLDVRQGRTLEKYVYAVQYFTEGV